MGTKGILILLIFSMLLVSYSCDKTKEKQKSTENQNVDTLETEDTTAVPSSILDEDFVNKPFEMDTLTVASLEEAFPRLYKIKKEPIKNVHVKNQIDTLVTVIIKNSQFIFYKTPEHEFITSAIVTNSIIKFSRDIRVGMTQKEFKSKFEKLKNLNALPVEVTISGNEASGNIVFTFKQGKLVKGEFIGYVD